MALESVAAVLKRRDRLLAAIRAEPCAEVWTGGDAQRVTGIALRHLPKRCRYDSVYQSVIGLVGSTPTDAALKSLAWALAGNVPALRAGGVPYPPRLPPTAVRLSVQVRAVRRLADFRPAVDNKFRVLCRLLILSGPACSTEIDVVWSSAYVRYFASHPNGLGFAGRRAATATKPARPYQHYSTLVGLRFTVEVQAATPRPTAKHVRCSASQRLYNQKLTAMRWRDGFACPFAFTHPCHACSKGQDQCPAACRPVEVAEKTCPSCHKAATVDPYWDQVRCLRCLDSRTKVRKPEVPP